MRKDNLLCACSHMGQPLHMHAPWSMSLMAYAALGPCMWRAVRGQGPHLEAGEDAGDGVGEVGVCEPQANATDEHHRLPHEPRDAHHFQHTIKRI